MSESVRGHHPLQQGSILNIHCVERPRGVTFAVQWQMAYEFARP